MKKSCNNGLFVICEGIDGSGKSTLINFLAQRYEALSPVLTRQPGGTPFGSDIRSLLKKYYGGLTPMSQLLLFAADRAEHISLVVKPALEEGKLVLCDRMIDSSLIYQGVLQGIPMSLVWQINEYGLQRIKSDATLYCRVKPEVAFERVAIRSFKETFDDARLSDFQKLVEAYDQIYKDREDVIWLDANCSEEELYTQAYQALEDSLELY